MPPIVRPALIASLLAWVSVGSGLGLTQGETSVKLSSAPSVGGEFAGSPVPAASELDLAAMTLTPGGLATAGLEGYGLSYAATQQPDAEAAVVAGLLGSPEEEVAARLLGAGLEGVYLASLDAPPPAPDAPDTAPGTTADRRATPVAGTPPPRQVYSYVYDFADESGAADAFAALEAAVTGGVPLPGTITFGDESALTRAVGTDPTTGLPATTLDLAFRVGDLVATVAVIDFGQQPPTVDELEALAARLETRVVAAEAGEAPGLSRLALRLEGDGASAAEDRYLLLGGEPLVRANESAAAREQRMRAYGGAVDAFSAYQAFPAGGAGSGDDLYFQTDLLRFADAAAAAAYLTSEPARLAGGATVSDLVERPIPAGLGVEAAVSYRSIRANGEPAIVERVYARVGAVVARVYMVGRTVPSGVVDALAAAQVACLEAGSCPAVPAPEEIFAGEATPSV